GIAEFVARANSVLPPDYHTRPLAEQRLLYASLVHEFPFPRPAGVVVHDDTVHDDTGHDHTGYDDTGYDRSGREHSGPDGSRHGRGPEGNGSGAGRAVPVRVYRPDRRTGRGAYLYLHGGGFVLGSLDTHDTIAAELAARSGQVVIAVDFRPAPEHPFPAALEDCYAALRGVAAEADRLDVDPGLLGVAGDSSGANLAVALCLVSRDRGGPPVHAQALVSPGLALARWESGGGGAAV